jgi:hypothetical protein
MLDAEDAIQDTINLARSLATAEALERFGTAGRSSDFTGPILFPQAGPSAYPSGIKPRSRQDRHGTVTRRAIDFPKNSSFPA